MFSFDIAYQSGNTYKDADGNDIYLDDATNKWYDQAPDPNTGFVGKTESSVQPQYIIQGTKESPVYLTRGEAQAKGITAAAGECDIKLCEGWQNNIWITIDPTRIIFDAEVYKWADKNTSYYPENTDKGNESMKKVE